MKTRLALVIACSLVGLIAVGLVLNTGGMAATTSASPRLNPAALEPRELTAFMDGFMSSNLGRFHAPGASVVVVKEGAVVFEKGYGFADLGLQSSFTPNTRFRAKSVSKTFTATAVMQLEEGGQVALDAPVTSYLHGFTLPGGNEPPITLAELLTQTSGIGDRALGTMTSDRIAAADLRGYLQQRMPSRVAAPGTVFSYADHGISLAGLTVEEVSGLPFAQYMQDKILEPLGMSRSAFDPPLEGQSDLAVGYQFVSGSYRPAPVGYFYVAPAVSLVTTGADMGRFLIGMLGGAGDSLPILRPETVQLMEARHFALQPGGPGVAYGLYEWPEIGERVLVHGGLGHGFSNLLVLLPDRHAGFFVDTNSDEPKLRYALLCAFMDRFYPAQAATSKPIGDSDPGRFAGVYSDYRYQGRIEALKELFDQGTITARGDQTLSLSWAPGQWAEVEPLVFQNLDDPNQRIAFRTDASGQVIQAYGPHDDGYRKVPWYRTLAAYAAGTLVFVVLFMSVPMVWLVSGLRRRRRREITQHRWVKTVSGLGALVGLLNLGFLVGVPLELLPYAGLNGTQLDFGAPSSLVVLFAIPLVTAALAVMLAAVGILAWRAKTGTVLARTYFAAIIGAALLFPGFLSYWSLFGLIS